MESGFKIQQEFFCFQSAAKPGQTTICTNHPVTGNNDGQWIATIGSAYCPHRLVPANAHRDILVGTGLSVRDSDQRLQDFQLKWRAVWRQQQVKFAPLSVKVLT